MTEVEHARRMVLEADSLVKDMMPNSDLRLAAEQMREVAIKRYEALGGVVKIRQLSP